MRTIMFILYVVLILAVSESVLAVCSKFSGNQEKCLANPECTYIRKFKYEAKGKRWRSRCRLAKPRTPHGCRMNKERRECENKDGCEWFKADNGHQYCRVQASTRAGTNIPTQLPSGPTDSGFVSGAGGQTYNQPSFEPNALFPPPPQILGSNTQVWGDVLTNSDFMFQAGANPPSFDPNAFNPSNTEVWQDGLTDSGFVFRAGANPPSFDPNAFNPSNNEVWQDGLADSGFVFRAGANPPSFVPSIMHPPSPNLGSVAEVLEENDLGSVPYPDAAALWELEAPYQLHDPFVEAQNVFYGEIEQHPTADCWTRKPGELTAASMDKVQEVMNSLLDCTPVGANCHPIVDERWTDEQQAMVDEAWKDAMEGSSFQSNNIPFNYYTMDTMIKKMAVDASAMTMVNREVSDLANSGNVAFSSSIPSSAHARSLKRPRSEDLPEPFFVCPICGQGVHNSICPFKPV